MKKLFFTIAFLSLTLTNIKSQTVLDIDGNTYNTITIGTQTWMKENLKVTHYNNGDSIFNVSNNNQWSNSTSGTYCYYDNKLSNVTTYGFLYNFYTVVDKRKLCPTGWHVPNNDEWNILIELLGGKEVASAKLRKTGNLHWKSPKNDATNISGFTALPGGYRNFKDGSFNSKETGGFWWSKTSYGNVAAWVYSLHDTSVHIDGFYNNSGMSIRCIKDN